jgi:hypothetical protein
MFPGDLVEMRAQDEIVLTLATAGIPQRPPLMLGMMEFCGKWSSVSSRVLKSSKSGLVILFWTLIEVIIRPQYHRHGCSFADANPQRVVRWSRRRFVANTSFESGIRVSERNRDERAVDNCIIGAHAMVLPLTTIGDGCILDAASLAVRKVALGSLMTGSPARVVGSKIQTTQFGDRVGEQTAPQIFQQKANACPL